MSTLMRFIALVTALLVYHVPAHAKWHVAESRNFRVYSDGKPSALINYVRELERYDTVLRLKTGVPFDRHVVPLDIYLVGTPAEVRSLAEMGKNVSGYYSSGPFGTAAFAIRGATGDTTGREIIFHEYAHHFMLHHFPFPYPAWFVEGFAEYYSTVQVTPTGATLGAYNSDRTSWLRLEPWLDYEDIFSRDVSAFRGNERVKFYAQSWLATHYLLRDDSRAKSLWEYLRRIEAREPLDAAFVGAFRVEMTSFGRTLQDYMKGKGKRMSYSKLTFDPELLAEVPVSMKPLPAAAKDLLLIHAALMSRRGRSERDLLGEIRALSRNYADDPYAVLILASAEAAFGDSDAARTLWDCQDFRVWAGIMGAKEACYVPKERVCDSG